MNDHRNAGLVVSQNGAEMVPLARNRSRRPLANYNAAHIDRVIFRPALCAAGTTTKEGDMANIHRCDTCTECTEEPRASRAPEGHVTVDPLFLDALREIPEEALEKDLPERARKSGAI